MNPFLKRKLIHLLLGMGLWFFWSAYPKSATVLFSILSVGILLLDVARTKVPWWKQYFLRWFGPMLKPEEYQGRLTGATLFMIALTVLVLIFPLSAAAAGILILTIADGLAGIVGRSFPLWHFPTGKSLAGSLTFFLVSFFIYFFIHPLPAPVALVLAGLITALEAILHGNWENLLVGLGAAGFFWFGMAIFG